MKSLCRDLKEEHETLDRIVANLTETDWDRITPFGEWSVRNEIAHLTYFDKIGHLAVTDPAGFAKHLEEFAPRADRFETDCLAAGKAVPVRILLSQWREERNILLGVLAKLDPKKRMSWFGPPMSIRSFTTARLMETWAHGQDVADTFGQEYAVSDRLKHIAHIGVSTFGWSYANRGKAIPDVGVRVELKSPSGESWIWGPEDAANIVRGNAIDFCLVVVRRRHVEDTGLVTVGEAASQWMRIAQAFAGPPEDGPEPGQFRKRG